MIQTNDVNKVGDVNMKLTCTSIYSTGANKSTSDDFVVSLQVPGLNCLTDKLKFMDPI